MVRRPALALPADVTEPAEAMGFQAAQNLVCGARGFPGWVDVLDAQQPLTTRGKCLQIAGRGGYEGAEMQRAGRRGRKAAPVRG